MGLGAVLRSFGRGRRGEGDGVELEGGYGVLNGKGEECMHASLGRRMKRDSHSFSRKIRSVSAFTRILRVP